MKRSLVLIFLLLTHDVAAEPIVRTISIIGRPTVTVTSKDIALSDIADIDSKGGVITDQVLALKKIKIASAPKPGDTLTLSAQEILNKIRDQGTDPSTIGYSLPRITEVKRAGRSVLLSEIEQAIRLVFDRQGRQAELKQVNFTSDIQIPPGETTIEAIPFQTNIPGRNGFQIEARVDGDPVAKFNVMAQVDEWQELPIATRTLKRGEVVGESDVARARLNINSIPRDIARDMQSIIGLETKQNIDTGDVFRQGALKIPPVIQVGTRVTAIYRSGLVEATATGVALEDGIQNQRIRIKNDSSKMIIEAKVIEPGLVMVER